MESLYLWARTSRHSYPHAIPCGPNSSPLFPPQAGRNSPLCIPGLRTPGPALAHPYVHAPAHAHTYGQGRSLELYVGNEWDRPGLALALDSLPEVEVSRMIKCKHGSRDVRGRGSFGVSTFGGKESRAHNHLGKTSWDWCLGTHSDITHLRGMVSFRCLRPSDALAGCGGLR